MKQFWIALLCIVVAVRGQTRQAPGDGDLGCLASPGRPNTDGRGLLLASFDYLNLLDTANFGDPGPWAALDVDQNSGTGSPVVWTEQRSSCNRLLFVCVAVESQANQNNWVITQYINNTARADVIINVTYSINECSFTCADSFDVFILETNNANQSFARNTSNFPTAATDTLTDPVRDGATRTVEIINFSPNVNMYSGFYLALRDRGSCISIDTLTVFSARCSDSIPSSGIVFPRAAEPLERLDGDCIPNAATPSGTTVNALCQTDGVWGMFTGDSVCSCVPGYTFDNTIGQCVGCPPFTFKNRRNNGDSCQPCPLRSNSSTSNTAVCACDPGFYRTDTEATQPCTEPPSTPFDLTTANVTNTTVFLRWLPSLDNGGRTDLFYTISANDSNATFATTTDTEYTLQGLIPFVYYEIRVTADNGVSAQAPLAEVNSRRITAAIMTLEDVGGVVALSSFDQGSGRVTWSPPDPPNGIILSYEVVVFDEGGAEIQRTNTTGTSLSITDLSPGSYSIQVRAFTGTGAGDFVEAFVFEVTADDSSSNIGPIVGGVVGGIVVLIVLILVIILLCFWCRRRNSSKGGATMSYAVQNDKEDVVKKLPGIRKYVDPQNYATPESALKDFACEIPSHELRLDEVIGGGEFGDVCRGIWFKDGSKHISVAIKTLKPGSPYKDRVDFLTEASIMGQFHHDNVITLHGVVTKTQPVMIVMEYMENKSLDVYLRKNDDLLGEVRLVAMAKGVAAGMEYFSDIGFVHRDLAARNVLVAKDEACKIADFGLSRETTDNAYDVKTGGKIPIRWTAPEAIQYRKFTTSSDVWSYGVLLWEVMSYGQQPYWDWSNHKVLDEVEAGYRLELPKDCPQSVYELMLDCWNYDHRLRPNFGEIGKELDTLLKNGFKSTRQTQPVAGAETSPLDFDSIAIWLRSIKMDRYQDNFKRHNILEPQDCLPLTPANLTDMGITLAGHQNKIMMNIQNANNRLQREPSFKI